MATMTITTTSAQDIRLVAAFTDLLKPVDGNGDLRNATAAEIKGRVIEGIKAVVHNYETRVVNEAASAAITPIEPT